MRLLVVGAVPDSTGESVMVVRDISPEILSEIAKINERDKEIARQQSEAALRLAQDKPIPFHVI